MNKLDRIDPVELADNPRATVAAWKKYEEIVVTAFRQHPRPYIYRPANMSPSTIASRIRDAIRGKIAFDHPSDVSTIDIAKWWSEVVVKHDKSQVLIGKPDEIQRTLQGETIGSTKPKDMVFNELSFEEVAAFTLLISTGRLNGPVLIKQPPDLSLLPERPNVEFIPRENGALAIL